MMTKLREKTTIIFIIVIISFVLFIFLQWGMDIVSSNKNIANNENFVGEVDGVKIPRNVYSAKLTEMRSNYLRNKEKSSLSDEEELALQDQAFVSIVDNMIFSKIEKKYGYFATQNELQEILMNVPPASIRQDKRFYDENGKFNLEMYKQIISDPNNRQFVQDYYRQLTEELPKMKMQMDIISSVKIENDEILRKIRFNETKFMVEYVVIPEKGEKNIEISDKEAEEFYNKNKMQFKIDAKAKISFIYFKKEPSSQDVLLTKENIEGLRNDILQGNVSFENCAKLYSEDYVSAEKNGELGYIKRGQTVKEFEKTAFSLKKGQISKPVKTSFGWHIIRCEDKTRDSVKVSHILIKIRPSYETLQGEMAKINAVLSDIMEFGFEEAAKKDSVEIVNTQSFNPEQGYIFELGGYARKVSNFVENSNIGDISQPIEENNYFVIVKIDEKENAGIPDFNSIKEIVKNRIILEKRRLLVSKKLAGIVAEIKEKKYSLKHYANLNKYNYNKSGMITGNDKLSYVSSTSRLYGAIFAAKENEIYFVADDNYNYIFKVLKMEEIDINKNKNLLDKYHQMLINERQQDLLDLWTNNLKKIYKIKDFRY